MSSSTVTNLFDGDPLALQSGDQLAGFAGTSATGNFTLTLSTEEFFDPTRWIIDLILFLFIVGSVGLMYWIMSRGDD